jgi:endonuclease/exonuclease/phosphatase family metal-dependent hydrolase
VNDDTVRVYNAHLASIRFQKEDYKALQDGPDSEDAKRLLGRLERAFITRSSQVKTVVHHLAADTGRKVILCGDFNDSPVSYAYEQISNYLDDSFIDAGKGLEYSFVGTFPPFRIDFVMHSPEIQTTDFQTHSVDFSDHRPVEVGFLLPE